MDDYYDYGALWGWVLPSGPGFCHWGGLALSEKILAATPDQGRLLDLCCGGGGTLSISQRPMTYGLDCSLGALSGAKVLATTTSFICADARLLPFGEASFAAVLMQDGDAWLGGGIQAVLRQVQRVLRPGGVLLVQTYCETGVSDEREAEKTQRLLRALGYPETMVPTLDSLCAAVRDAAFHNITVESVHEEYETDAAAMLERFRQHESHLFRRFEGPGVERLGAWLEWALGLYQQQIWSGVLLRAVKA